MSTIHTPGTRVRGTYCQDTPISGVVVSSRLHSLNAQMYEVKVKLDDGSTYMGQPRELVLCSVLFDGSPCPWNIGFADSLEVAQ